MNPQAKLPALALITSVCMASSIASAADFPSRTIRIITSDAGGSGDITSRLIAASLTRLMRQSVIVENRGGSGVIPGQAVASAPPDGHTVLMYSATVWLLPLLHDNVPFDPVRDFAPVTLATCTPMLLVVNPALPVRSVKELMALARARPGELSYGSAGIGGSNHLSPELFKAMARVNILHVGYKGVGPALNDLISGRLQIMFPAFASGISHVRTGRLRLLALTTAQPSPLAPGVPTVAASGLPGYESSFLSTMLAPAKTPSPVIARLNQDVLRALKEPEVKDKLFSIGIETVGSTPDELSATTQVEVAKWSKLIRDAGIRGY